MPNKLSIEEVETIARNAESQERTPAYSALAVNIKLLAQQLADTMRENERHALLIAECRDALDAILPYAEGTTFSFLYAIKQAKETRERCEMAV